MPPEPESNADPDTTVLIPLFDADCAGGVNDKPPNTTRDACLNGSGTGQAMWYHLADWTAFEIDWVSLNDERRTGLCDTSDVIEDTPGNGSTGCFAGWFRGYFGPGDLRAPTDGDDQTSAVGIQLIK